MFGLPRTVRKPLLRMRKTIRRYLAQPALQQPYRLLYRFALAGMNYGGAGSSYSAGDELALQTLARTRRNSPPTVFDVGANTGAYIRQALDIIGDDVILYAFEPSKAAFAQLESRFGARPNVHLVPHGAGARASGATLWAPVPGSVLASTYVSPLEGNRVGEPITLVTLDQFCEQHDIRHIDLLKLDVEGGELDALRGAARLLESKAIDMIQFEFGQGSLGARTYFSDLFSLLSGRYEIYRVLPAALDRIPAYDETLEIFMSTNYVAVART